MNIESIKIIKPKFLYSVILKSILTKKILSRIDAKNLNNIPVPRTVIKNPVNLEGILSFIKKLYQENIHIGLERH